MRRPRLPLHESEIGSQIIQKPRKESYTSDTSQTHSVIMNGVKCNVDDLWNKKYPAETPMCIHREVSVNLEAQTCMG